MRAWRQASGLVLLVLTTGTTDAGKKVKEDFSSPRGVVETLIEAAASRDKEVISKCFADDAAKEFKALRDKTATDTELGKLATFFAGAKVGEAKIEKDRAVVEVKLKTRTEKIETKKTAKGWKIVDF